MQNKNQKVFEYPRYRQSAPVPTLSGIVELYDAKVIDTWQISKIDLKKNRYGTITSKAMIS